MLEHVEAAMSGGQRAPVTPEQALLSGQRASIRSGGTLSKGQSTLRLRGTALSREQRGQETGGGDDDPRTSRRGDALPARCPEDKGDRGCPEGTMSPGQARDVCRCRVEGRRKPLIAGSPLPRAAHAVEPLVQREERLAPAHHHRQPMKWPPRERAERSGLLPLARQPHHVP